MALELAGWILMVASVALTTAMALRDARASDARFLAQGDDARPGSPPGS